MNPVALVLGIVALVVSARIRVAMSLAGAHASFPVLGLVFAAIVLALAIMLLYLLRTIARDGGLRLRPVVVRL